MRGNPISRHGKTWLIRLPPPRVGCWEKIVRFLRPDLCGMLRRAVAGITGCSDARAHMAPAAGGLRPPPGAATRPRLAPSESRNAAPTRQHSFLGERTSQLRDG